MNELRKAAEMALDSILDIPMDRRSFAQMEAVTALRQALAEPEREWASLTGYQRLKFADRFHISGEAIEAIEQALKEKNGV